MNMADIWSTWFLDPLYVVQEQRRSQKEMSEALERERLEEATNKEVANERHT